MKIIREFLKNYWNYINIDVGNDHNTPIIFWSILALLSPIIFRNFDVVIYFPFVLSFYSFTFLPLDLYSIDNYAKYKINNK